MLLGCKAAHVYPYLADDYLRYSFSYSRYRVQQLHCLCHKKGRGSFLPPCLSFLPLSLLLLPLARTDRVVLLAPTSAPKSVALLKLASTPPFLRFNVRRAISLIFSASRSPSASALSMSFPLTPSASLATCPSFMLPLSTSFCIRLASAACSRTRLCR